MVAQVLGGLADDDPLLASLVDRTDAIVRDGGAELSHLQPALTPVAQPAPPPHLTAALDSLLCAAIPSAPQRASTPGRERGVDSRRRAAHLGRLTT